MLHVKKILPKNFTIGYVVTYTKNFVQNIFTTAKKQQTFYKHFLQLDTVWPIPKNFSQKILTIGYMCDIYQRFFTNIFYNWLRMVVFQEYVTRNFGNWLRVRYTENVLRKIFTTGYMCDIYQTFFIKNFYNWF